MSVLELKSLVRVFVLKHRVLLTCLAKGHVGLEVYYVAAAAYV